MPFLSLKKLLPSSKKLLDAFGTGQTQNSFNLIASFPLFLQQ